MPSSSFAEFQDTHPLIGKVFILLE